MFTGIIQSVGRIEAKDGPLLEISAGPELQDADWILGESVAVNGCCLTLIACEDLLQFQLSPETFERTTFSLLQVGDRVNLERAMSASSRFGGHFVQGHVDDVAKVVARREAENSLVLEIEVAPQHVPLLIDKGSVALDGVSLTVVSPKDGKFEVWLVPHTLQATTLEGREPGDKMNLELDMIAKYVQNLVRIRDSSG